ncbi:MAG: type IV secretion system protein [Campylobacteraceae bacterium]|jgi:hypothetical protein|nr:type IV secretion system protein [Campylobacteraceae bacterium]
MKSIKRFILGFSMLILTASNSFSGILVEDLPASMQRAISYGETVLQYTKEAEDWLLTIEHYQKQIDAYRKQFEALTEGKRYIEIFNQLLILGEEMEKIRSLSANISGILNNQELGISDKSAKIREQFDTYNTCEVYANKAIEGDEQKVRKAENAQKACTLLFNVDYMDITGLQELSNQIKIAEELLQKIKAEAQNTTNIKSAQDLANFISIIQEDIKNKKDELKTFSDNMKTVKSMAKNLIAQFKALSSDTSTNLGEYKKSAGTTDNNEW